MARARGQDGLTLLETLVMIAVTALVGAALVNVATRANAANYARAARTLDTEAMRRIETELRRAGVAAAPSVTSAGTFTGDSRFVRWPTIGYTACANGAALTTFAIEANASGSRIVRSCGPRATVLAQLPAGVRADFAFSTDGSTWRVTPAVSAPREPGAAQGGFVRLRLRGPGAEDRVSIARLGGAALAAGAEISPEAAP